MDTNVAQPGLSKPSGGFGKLFLHDPELPGVACTLLELKPEHCRGFVPLSELNPETLLAWQQKLIPREKLRIRVEFMRGLPGLELEGTVQSVKSIDDGVEIQLNFPPSSSLHRAVQARASIEDDVEILHPIEPARPGSGLHKSSVITLTPLTPEEIMALQAEEDAARAAAGQANADGSVPPERSQQNNFVSFDRPAGRATVDAVGFKHSPPNASPPKFDANDATVEFERPESLLQPPSTKPAAEVKPPAPVTASPAQTAPTPHVTVEIERPAELKKPPHALGSTVDIPRAEIPKAALGSTIDIARTDPKAAQPEKGAAPPLDATVDLGSPSVPRQGGSTVADGNPDETIQTERRAAKRDSGFLTVAGPAPGSPAAQAASKKLGEVLVQMGKLTTEQVDEVVRLAQESGQRMGRCLLAWELVSPDVLCRALSIQSGLPMTVLEGDRIPDKLNKIFPLPMMMRFNFVPFDESAAVLCVAAANPIETEVTKELERISRKVVEVFMAREDQVARQLDWMRVKMKTRSRRNLRYKMTIPALYQFCSRLGVRSDKDVYEGHTVNLSAGGFLIEAPQAPGNPSELLMNGLYVNACLKAAPGEIWAICDVREIRLVPDSTPSRWLLGVEIVDINEECRVLLKEVCKEAKKGKK